MTKSFLHNFFLLLISSQTVLNSHQAQTNKKELVNKISQLLQTAETTTLNEILQRLNRLEKPIGKINYPIVVNTWPFVNATERAWDTLTRTDDSVLAVIDGCTECEELRCDGTVGYGGSPDENAETTLDALIMDGKSHDAGSVANLKRIKSAIKVARAVMNFTTHTLLVGDSATQFAVDMGFRQEDLHAEESLQKWIDWRENSCQPNFRINVRPEASENCGPYRPINEPDKFEWVKRLKRDANSKWHDTIGMIAIDSMGNIAGGTSTNGASHKVPGRVGDSPIIGSGAYVDNEIGAACGTGDGDTLMKFLPAYQTVESMRNGLNPADAAQDAILRIMKYYQNFVGAIVAVDKFGNHGAACHGIPKFPYSYKDSMSSEAKIAEVLCV